MASIVVTGDTSGAITLSAPSVAGTNTLSLPAVTDTLVGLAATQTLTNKSIAATQLTGTIAAARLPTGSVLQVVQGTTSTYASTADITYVDTTLTATITPSSASNKILVIVSQNGVYKEANAQSGINLRLLRGATVIQAIAIATFYDATTAQQRGSISSSFFDSPATTSATTYKTQFSNDGAGAGLVAVQNNAGSTTSSIILMEIVG